MPLQHISPAVTVKCCISIAMDGTHDDRCGMAVKRMGLLGVSVRKMKSITVTKETVTLTGKGR
jgi:hypothetical protein